MYNMSNDHTFAVLAYEDSPYLEECLLSLINQTIKSKIIIFTSTPSEFLKKISKKFNIVLIINEHHQGIADDWNFAYNHCDTKYVTLVHQDDIYLPQYAETCIKMLEREKRALPLIVFTWYGEKVNGVLRLSHINFLIKKFILLPFMIKSSISSNFLKKSVLIFGNPVCCPTVMYHKGFIGFVNFSNDFQCNMDWDAWLRLAVKQGSFVFINKRLLWHRLYKKSQTSVQIERHGRSREDALIFNRIWPKAIAGFLVKLYSLSYKMNEK